MRRFQTKQYGILCFILFVLFTLVSVYDGGTMTNRAIRLFPNIMALGIILLLFNYRTNRMIIGFLVFILLSAGFAFYYEIAVFRELTLVCNLLAYLLLGGAVIPKFSKIKASWLLGIYFGICLIFWVYALFQLTEISKDQLANSFHYILMNLSNIGLIFILSSALLFVHQNPTKVAMAFLGFAVAFLLSEIARGASYYSTNRVELFFYGCRILYALAMALAVYTYALMDASKNEKLTP